MTSRSITRLADTRVLGALLEEVNARHGGYELLDHWKQGEFHHDVVLRVTGPLSDLPGPVLVVSTNCNGGVKEVLVFSDVPDRLALWHWRCPTVLEFAGDIPNLLERAITEHWFDPCELLGEDARSEIRVEHRQRQAGGGWQMNAAPSISRRS
jgi:hypothetical protein